MSGFLWCDGEDVRGTLVDALGFVTEIHGTRKVRNGVPGYELTATVVVPEGMRIPWLDESDAAAG